MTCPGTDSELVLLELGTIYWLARMPVLSAAPLIYNPLQVNFSSKWCSGHCTLDLSLLPTSHPPSRAIFSGVTWCEVDDCRNNRGDQWAKVLPGKGKRVTKVSCQGAWDCV